MRIMHRKRILSQILSLFFLISIILCQSKTSSALSIGLSPSKIVFNNLDNNLNIDNKNNNGNSDYKPVFEEKEFFVFNPNDVDITVKFYTKNYVIKPQSLIIKKNSYTKVLIKPKICSDENISLIIISKSNLLPSLNLKVKCNLNENNRTNKTDNAIHKNKLWVYDIEANENNHDNHGANPIVGLSIIFLIVGAGLSLFYFVSGHLYE